MKAASALLSILIAVVAFAQEEESSTLSHRHVRSHHVSRVLKKKKPKDKIEDEQEQDVEENEAVEGARDGGDISSDPGNRSTSINVPAGQGGAAGGQDQDRTVAGQGGAAGGQDPDRTIVVETPQTGGTGSTDDGTRNIFQPVNNGIVFSNGNTLTYGGLYEVKECAPFRNDVSHKKKAYDSRGDFECRLNSCRGGCCRDFQSYLLCDEDNHFPSRQCICNENTFVHPSSITQLPIGVNTTDPTDITNAADDSGDRTAGDSTGVISISDPPIPSSTPTEQPTKMPTGQPTEQPSNPPGSEPKFGDDDYCYPHFAGKGWGISPTDPLSLPVGISAGDCTENSHCLPSSLQGFDVCCKYYLYHDK